MGERGAAPPGLVASLETLSWEHAGTPGKGVE